MSAIRSPLFVLAVTPVWLASAALLFYIWPWRLAAKHLLVLALMGAIVAYICLAGFRKIPFTCSYLPGKSYVHMAILTSMGLLLLLTRGTVFEAVALSNPKLYAIMIAVLAAAVAAVRWWGISRSEEEDAVVQFEEIAPPAIQALGLNRDGVVITSA